MLVLFILAALTVGCSAEYPPESDVINLTDDNFDSMVIQSDKIWVVQFYYPWDEDHKRIVDEFTKAAKDLFGLAKVGAVDANQHLDIQIKYDVESIPTILFFSPKNKGPEVYNGPLTAEAIINAVVSVKAGGKLETRGRTTWEIILIVIGVIFGLNVLGCLCYCCFGCCALVAAKAL